jgi:hypothetical protein
MHMNAFTQPLVYPVVSMSDEVGLNSRLTAVQLWLGCTMAENFILQGLPTKTFFGT